jgi:hypothetical protein
MHASFDPFLYVVNLLTMSQYLTVRMMSCQICGAVVERRCNNQKYCDECRAKPRSWQKAWLNYGSRPPETWTPQFECAVCHEIHPRRSGAQKYCDRCEPLGRSRTVAKYYRRHRRKILRRKAKYREANHARIVEAQRRYHQETKAERPTRAMLREMQKTG